MPAPDSAASAQASTTASARRGVQVVGEGLADRGQQALAGRAGRRRGGRAPAGQPLLAGLEHVVGPLPVGAVVVGEQAEPDRHRVDAVAAQAGDEDQVALGLRHLLAVQADHAGVHVVRGERRLRR